MNNKNKEAPPASRISPTELTQIVAKANVFDLKSLQANRAGRLSLNQFLVSLTAIASFIFILAGFYWLFSRIPIGFIYMSTGSPQKAIIPWASSVVVLFIYWLIFFKGELIGLGRYAAKDLSQLPFKSLLLIDLLLWRVALYQGPVARNKSSGLVYTRDYRDKNNTARRDPFAKERTVNYYAYKAGKDIFPVSYDGYSALPIGLHECRLYYLPLSGIIVNLEIL